MESIEVIVLDTHVLIWSVTDDRKLGRSARALLDRYWAKAGVAVSAIAFWEAAMLQSRGRIALPAPPAEWRQELLAAGLIELAVDGAIAIRAVDLEGVGDDPADRLVMATALAHGAALLTADDRLLGCPHALARHDARA